MKQRKWLNRVAATAAAAATLLTGGIVADTAMAAEAGAEKGLAVSKTVTATDRANVFDVNLSATGRDWAKNKEHALFVLDRTGSVGQAEYNEIANMVRSLGKRLMATGQVQVSVVLFAGGAWEENSVWYDGYENVVTHSTDPADLDGVMVPVSTTTHNGVFYGSEYGTNCQAGFDGASNVMANEQLPTDVFFFSDGHPNTWPSKDNPGQVTPQDEEEAFSRALSTAKDFAAKYGDHIQNFTSVGLQRDGQDLSKLQQLSEDVFGAKAKTEFASDGDQVGQHLESNVESELMDGGFAKQVTLTDRLSGNVKPVSTDAKGRPGLSVKVSTDGKTPVALAEGKDYEYSYANGQISVKLVDQLKGLRTVTVTIPVKPTDKVLQQVVAGQTGPDTGDANTGDFSGKHGWYSNTGENTVTHVSPNTGETGTSMLPKPVIVPQVAKLQYDKNATKATGGMSKNTVTAPAGTSQTIAANGFQYTDHTFQGWNTQADGKGQAYAKGDKLTLPEGTTTLYAQWKRIPASIHYDPNGGHGKTPDTNGGQGETTTLTPQRLFQEMLAVRLLEHQEGRFGRQVHRQAGRHPQGRTHPVRAVEARSRMQGGTRLRQERRNRHRRNQGLHRLEERPDHHRGQRIPERRLRLHGLEHPGRRQGQDL